MRWGLLLCLVGACDPVWRVENVASASATTHADATCIEAGLRASGFSVQSSGAYAPPIHGWYVGGDGQPAMRVAWDPRKPGTITLGMVGAGTQAPRGSVPAYRHMRDSVMAKLTGTCGTFELGPESCDRVECVTTPRR